MQREIKLRYDGKILSKKNRHVVARIGGRTAVLPDHAAQENESKMIAQFIAQLQADGRTSGQIWKDKARRVLEAERAGATYEIGIKIWQADGIRRDLDNQCSTLMDAMVRSGAIPDDCRKFVRMITIRDEGIDKDRPGAEITITETTNN